MNEQEQYTPDSDDEMGTSGDEVDEILATLTPQEWKAKAGDLYKVSSHSPRYVWVCAPAAGRVSPTVSGDISSVLSRER